MPAIKSLNKISEKWARKTPLATEDYRDGVNSPRKDWETTALAGVENMKSGFQEAAADGRIERGISDAGTEKWQRNARGKGAQRFGPGARAGESDFNKGFSPFHSVISNTTLPPRGPKGSPANIERVSVMAQALHNAKIGR